MEQENPKIEQHEQRPGGIGIPGEVAYNCFLTQTEKILFGYLQNLDRTSKHCWASNEYLGKLVGGVVPRVISRALKNLQNYSYITIELIPSRQGTSRVIAINPEYTIIYKPLVNTYFEYANELEATPLYELLSTMINKIVEVHAPGQTSPAENEAGQTSPEGRTISSTNINIDLNKYIPVGISADSAVAIPEPLYKTAEDLFDYWNMIGEPLLSHVKEIKGKPTKLFETAISRIKGELERGYTKAEIAEAMDLYHEMLDNPDLYKLRINYIGHRVSISRFMKQDLLGAYGLKPAALEDPYPNVTARLKSIWKQKGFTNSRPQDENCFIKASGLFVDYLKKNGRKISTDSTESINEPSSLVKYLVDAILFRIEGRENDFNVTPGWLCHPSMFESNLPRYLKHHDILDREN